MKALVKAGTALILMAWVGASAVQARAAEKRVKPETSAPSDNWIAATVPSAFPLPADWMVRRARRSPASEWTPNDGARLVNIAGENLIPGTINSSWNNASGGNWSTGTDWTPNGVPNNGGGNVYNVTLPTLSSNYTTTLDITASIDSLTVDSGSTLNADSGVALTATSLTISSGGQINLSQNIGSTNTLSVTGNVNNSGQLETGFSGGTNTVKVTGTFTNNAGATLEIGQNRGSTDVANIGILTNSGTVEIDNGGTLNLTNQPNGITDVVQGSKLVLEGALNAGSANGLAKLTSVEGTLNLENGITTSVTPSGGTLTISSTGQVNLSQDQGATTTLSVTGGVNNSGQLETGFSGGTNTVNVTGTFTNNAGATLEIGQNRGSTDVANIGILTNSGTVEIDNGGTLNLTNQPNGITDVVQGSKLVLEGALNAGSANGLAKLTSVEGTLDLENGIATSVTPSGGTLTISSTGQVLLSQDQGATTTLSVTGSVNNSGQLETGFSGGTNTVKVTGTFTNNAGATLEIGQNRGSTDVANIGILTNSGTVEIDNGGTLNLTNQPNGITDVVQGSKLVLEGALNAGSANGLAKLTSVEGTLDLENGIATSVTPSGGTLTISSTGQVLLSQDQGATTTLSVTGSVNNSGQLETGFSGGTNTVKVTGTFTNNAGATLEIGQNRGSTDVANIGILTNSGTVEIDNGGTLNLTNQPNGITDVVQGSKLVLEGALNAGSANGLAKLTSVEGTLDLENGMTTSVTPSGGTLTISSTGQVLLSQDQGTTTTLSVTGNVNNSGQLETGFSGGTNTVNVTGAFTNNAGATLQIGQDRGSTDVANIGTLTNSGAVMIDTGDTLNLTTAGTDTNSATVNVGTANGTGTLKISAAAVTLSGAGKVVMSNLAGNLITAAAPTDILTSANTIEGSGNIGNGNMGFVNTGTVEANQSTALIIDPSSSGFNNKGTVNVSTGDTLEITGPANSFLNYSSTSKTLTGGTYLVSGTLQFGATGNTITTDAAKITLTGAAAKIVDPSGGDIIAPLATIASASLFDITSGANFTTVGNFTNNGTLTVGSGSKFVVKSGSSLTNFSGTTLTGGIYNVTGQLQFGPTGTSLVTNAASITLTGTHAKIVDTTNQNILTAFATNNAGATFDITSGYNFTTAGNFTNNGSLVVGTSSTFDVNGNLTNFNSTTDTLTNGTYSVTGTLQFNNADIVTNTANLTLNGSAYKIINQSSVNALTNFATNSSPGSFTLANNAGFTTASAFTDSGTVKVSKGSTLAIGGSGNYNQTAGQTTVDGTLTTTGAGIIQISSGSVFGNGGNLNGNTSNSGTLNIGDAVKQAGAETVTGTYTQNTAGALAIDIGGTTAGTQFDQLTITGAASLNGTLNLDLINGFVPTMTETFDIINFASLTGTFATVNGTMINSNEHFGVVYGATSVTLDVLTGPTGAPAWGGSPLDPPGGTPSTPEPGSLLLLGTGLAGVAGYLRRRK